MNKDSELDIKGLRILRGLLMREYNWDAFKEYNLRQNAHRHYSRFIEQLSRKGDNKCQIEL